MSTPESNSSPPPPLLTRPLLAHVLPYAAYGLVGIAAMRMPEPWNDLGYPLVMVAVVAALVWGWKSLDFGAPVRWLPAVATGVAVFLIWVLPYDLVVPEASRKGGYDPFGHFAPATAWTLVAVRWAGAALVVPVMEELLVRGLLQRWLVDEDFQKVRHGTYTPVSFWGVVIFFAVTHGWEWPVAAVCATVYGWLYVRTRSLLTVMIAHGVTNFLLGAYVVATGRWYFW